MTSRPNLSSPPLALLGAAPAFAEKLHVGRPNIGNREALMTRIGETIDSRWLTNGGPNVREFEMRLAQFLDVRHAIAICNGTVALEIAMRAAGVSGEIIVPSFTFVATAHAIQWQGYKPVFCDIDPRTHNIDPACAESLITPNTTAIIGVHAWGRGCDVDELKTIAERHGLRLMFDAAHAFACTHGHRMIGAFGDAEVFSFHATKFFNTFEGGAICTNDDDLAARIRLMKNFGFSGRDNATYIGTNGKMSEISAAMGLTSLESVDEFIAHNRANYDAYNCHLASIAGVTLMPYDTGEQNNYQYVVLEIDADESGLTRDALVKVLEAENVLARRYFYPGAHRMEPYRSFQPHAHLVLPETEALCQRVLLMPTGTAIGEKEIAIMAGIITTALEHAEQVRQSLGRTEAAPGETR